MMNGNPRKRSVYPAARTRSGKNTGPLRVRTSAMRSATALTVMSERASTCRFSRNPSQTFGSAFSATAGSKNAPWTPAQPGVLITVAQTTPANTRVEAIATRTDRRSRPRR